MTDPHALAAALAPIREQDANRRGGVGAANHWHREDPAGAWRVEVTPPSGKTAKVAVCVFTPATADTPCCVDTIDLRREAARRAIEGRLTADMPDDSRAALRVALDALALQLARRPAASEPETNGAQPLDLRDPDPWPEPVDGGAALAAVKAYIEGFVALPPHAAVVCALWLAHTYCFAVWPVTPYLLIVSPTRACGKTTLLDVLAALARRALTGSDATPAALYRMIAKWTPTVLLDEIDAWLTGKREDGLVNLLNAGSRRGGAAYRCTGEGATMDVAPFPVYCPKVLSGISAPLPDATRSRAIAIRLEKASEDQLHALAKFSPAHTPATAAPLTQRLMRWTRDLQDADALNVHPPLPDGIAGRDGDVWGPLVALADAAGGEWPALARAAAVASVADAARDLPRDLGEQALRDLRAALRDRPHDRRDVVPSADLVEWLKAEPEKPWVALGKSGLTPKRLADYLRRFGVESQQVRDADSAKLRGYSRAAILAAATRYCPELEKNPPPPPHAGHAGHAGHFDGDTVARRGGPASLAPDASHTGGGEELFPPTPELTVERGDGVTVDADGTQRLTPERIAALRAERAARRERGAA